MLEIDDFSFLKIGKEINNEIQNTPNEVGNAQSDRLRYKPHDIESIHHCLWAKVHEGVQYKNVNRTCD